MKQGQNAAAPKVEGSTSILASEEAWELLHAGETGRAAERRRSRACLDELQLDAGQIDEFYGLVEELHIELVAEEETVDSFELQGSDVSTDALQLFLKDIGKSTS